MKTFLDWQTAVGGEKKKKRPKKRENRIKGDSASVKENREGIKKVAKEKRFTIIEQKGKEQIKCCDPHKFTDSEINGRINLDGLCYLLQGICQIIFCKAHYKLQAWCKSKVLLN